MFLVFRVFLDGALWVKMVFRVLDAETGGRRDGDEVFKGNEVLDVWGCLTHLDSRK